MDNSDYGQALIDPGRRKKFGPAAKAIVGFYAGAILSAVAHLAFAIAINGKFADQSLSQGVATTLSTFIAALHGFFLTACLGIVFTQLLWRRMRLSFHEAGTIDDLFLMRTNFASFCKIFKRREMFVFSFITLIVWLRPVYTNIPPSAITVEIAQRAKAGAEQMVPTFNASQAGNGTFNGVSAISLIDFRVGNPEFDLLPNDTIVPQRTQRFTDPDSIYFPRSDLNPPVPYMEALMVKNNVRAMMERVMSKRSRDSLISPCGVNCSFTVEFEGPYLSCVEEPPRNVEINSRRFPNIYEAFYTAAKQFPKTGEFAATPTSDELDMADARLTMKTYQPGQIGYLSRENESEWFMIDAVKRIKMTEFASTCRPAVAKYKYDNTFVENEWISNFSTEYLRDFLDFKADGVKLPALDRGGTLDDTATNRLRDINILAVIDTFGTMLSTNVSSFASIATAATADTTNPITWQDPCWSLNLTNIKTVETYSIVNGTTLPFTPIFQNSSDPADLKECSFNNITARATPELLNEMLGNITLSLIPTLNLWQGTPVCLTVVESSSAYIFSGEKRLTLPYVLSLLSSLPFVVLGLLALKDNGVSAQEHSFLQLLCTTRGSDAIDHRVREACYGGDRDKDMPESLMRLRLMFGKFKTESSSSRRPTVVGNTIAEEGLKEAGRPTRPGLHRADSTNSESTRTGEPWEEVGLNEGDAFAKSSGRERPIAGFGTVDEIEPLETSPPKRRLTWKRSRKNGFDHA